jgi:hypothetical protein
MEVGAENEPLACNERKGNSLQQLAIGKTLKNNFKMNRKIIKIIFF